MKPTNTLVAMAAILALQPTANSETILTVGGHIEVAAITTGDSSDITLATLEIDLASQVNNLASVDVVLLYEEDATDFNIDTATVNLALSDRINLAAGRSIVPFGVYDSRMITDPLTKELAETHATALQVELATGSLTTSLYAFNGAYNKTAIDNWGINLAYTNDGFSVGLGYIGNLTDSDTIGATLVDEKMPGLGLNASVSAAPITLTGEYITANGSFKGSNVTKHLLPHATSLELAYAMDSTTLAVGLQNSSGAEALELSKRRTLASISNEIIPNNTLALEWARDEDYAGESTHTITAQLTVAF